MKSVLITGGSRGIGAELVRRFSSEGYQVAFTYKNSAKEAQLLAKECGAFAIKADSCSEEDVTLAVKSAIDHLGKIDCLINNAAISSFRLFVDLSLEEWQKTLDTNLTGAFLYSREALRNMISRQSGVIINISSVWGLVGSSMEVHYSTTKAALIGLTKALAKEMGPSGIRVLAIAPGVVDTDMNKCLSNEDIEALKDETPLMRVGQPSEIADAALFLASDKASFITGEILNVSGGFVI